MVALGAYTGHDRDVGRPMIKQERWGRTSPRLLPRGSSGAACPLQAATSCVGRSRYPKPPRRYGEDMSEQPAMGATVRLGRGTVYIGSCSWTERTLVQESDWYPERSMSAEERLRFYASRLALTEVDSTYYAPPREHQARLWAQRTPDGFRFDVKAYSLLTGHPTRPQSLWSDLREQTAGGDAREAQPLRVPPVG